MASPSRKLPATPQNQRLGIVFAVLAALLFASQDGVSKHLATNYEPVSVTMFRYWVFAVFVLTVSSRAKGGIRAVARCANPSLQFFRGMLLVLQICIVIWSFANLGLISTHVILASVPLMVTALSVPFLGEKVGWHRSMAVAAGFAGMLMIVLRPDQQAVSAAGLSVAYTSLIPLVGTLMFATYQILTRYVSRTDSAETSFFWTGIGGAVTITLIGPFFWDPMRGVDWLWMLTLSVMATLGHYLTIRALAITEASSIQPFFYLYIVSSAILAMLVFGEAFTPSMLAGALIIMASGLYTFRREWRRKHGG